MLGCEVRLAAEAVYDGAPVGPVFETLAVARQLDDPRALAEALSLSHHALLAPEHLADRLTIADDLIRVATSAGDSLRVLFGLLWKAVDQFHAGDVAAVRTLNELRHRADAVGCRTVSYMVSAIDVMRTIREGRLDEAEAAADDCFTFGIDLGDADATGYYGVHLLTIRWLQDRDAELLDLARDIASSDTLVAPDFAFRAGVAAVAARAGLVDEAIAGVRSLGPLDCAPALEHLAGRDGHPDGGGLGARRRRAWPASCRRCSSRSPTGRPCRRSPSAASGRSSGRSGWALC